MSETKFGAWSAPEARVAVEYSLVVVEEIRQAVSEGFQRFARGGIEVGGVLYGTYDGTTARILAVREIACEHARGPSFALSDKDRAALTDQIEEDREDPRLAGFTPLGFYVSHTRSDIALPPTDLEILNSFFPEPSQIALVVRPGRAGSMRAGFFVREADGTVMTERSYLDFNFPDRIAIPHSPMDRHPRERPLAERRVLMPSEPPRVEAEARDPEPSVDLSFREVEAPRTTAARAPEYAPVPRPKGKWLAWTISIAVVLAAAVAAVAGLRYFASRAPTEPIALAVYERDAQLRIEWNHASATIRNAVKGSLEIVDGQDMQTVPLSADDLMRGSFTYVRHTGDIQVRMEVQNADGARTVEASRFLGEPPRSPAAEELETTKQERDKLQDQLTGMRAENARQADRVKQLERTLAILRTRLGIVTPAPAANKK